MKPGGSRFQDRGVKNVPGVRNVVAHAVQRLRCGEPVIYNVNLLRLLRGTLSNFTAKDWQDKRKTRPYTTFSVLNEDQDDSYTIKGTKGIQKLYVVRNGVLMKRSFYYLQELRIVVLLSMQKTILNCLHDPRGHFVFRKMHGLINKYFYRVMMYGTC